MATPHNRADACRDLDEVEFFRALEAAGVRALLIGRGAMVVLGLPV